ncbi:MAG: DUF4410 domain-containing protein [Methylacidiphilales bacterium]|nr:DUF4410 domain-containing protein [Candidatus Methylacidiphilales bacterium]
MILSLALVSCASVSVEDGTEHATPKMPEIVYVTDFGAAHGDFQVDRTGKDLAEFKQNLQLMLKTAMTTDLTDRLVPAVAWRKSDASRHKNAWLVRGEFTTVYQGSRLLRGAIGFGAGATKLETHVEVYDLSQNSGTPFMTFSTTGGSNSEPGAILTVTTDPLSLAIGGIAGVAHGLSEDTKRTAREITAKFSDYMYHRGWISEQQWIKPKHQNGGDIW